MLDKQQRRLKLQQKSLPSISEYEEDNTVVNKINLLVSLYKLINKNF